MTGNLCKLKGCDRKVRARSMCDKHYKRWRSDADPKDVRKRARNGEPHAWLLNIIEQPETDACITWPYTKNQYGYGAISLPGGTTTTASRYLCTLVNGDPPSPDCEAAHACGRGHEACVNPKHVYWATRSQNQKDKILHGTALRGEAHWKARLTEKDIREIRMSGVRVTDLSTKFNVTMSAICQIKARRCWAWVQDEAEA